MYMALYRKYRPTKFDEVVGQDIIVRILKNSIKNERVSHAYLFSGPRGTGKTTVARILAKTINCLNPLDGDCCNKCDNCLNIKNSVDIIELDAASNNGVDEIRNIKEKINFSTTSLKYKVYIIDEVHMLSIGAFNALLKVLEEPPSHVVFILATTDIQKVPGTIVSRCQCMDFNKISENNIFAYLKHVIELENIAIDDDALKLIAKYSNGGMRDALGLLDKTALYSDKLIDKQTTINVIGAVDNDVYKRLLETLKQENYLEFFDIINKTFNDGKDLVLFAQGLVEYIRNMLIDDDKALNKEFDYYSDLIFKINDLINSMKKSDQYKILLETGLICIFKKYNMNSEEKKVELSLTKELKNSKKIGKAENNLKETDEYMENKSIFLNNAFATASKSKMLLVTNKLSNLEANNENLFSIYETEINIFKDGNIRVAGEGYLVISFKYDSLVKRAINDYKQIQKYLFALLNERFEVAFLSDDDWISQKKIYIGNIKNNYKYELQKKVSSSSVKKDDIVNLLGNDIIEYV